MRRRPLLALLVLSTFLLGPSSFASDLTLVHARIYPSPNEPPIEDGTILLHNGRIRAVGSSSKVKGTRFSRATTVLDCHGLVVTAGFLEQPCTHPYTGPTPCERT